MRKSNDQSYEKYWQEVDKRRRKNRRRKKIRSSVIFLALIFLVILTGKNIINSFASKGVEQPSKKTEIQTEKQNPKKETEKLEIDEEEKENPQENKEKVEETEEEDPISETQEEKPLTEVLKDDLALEASEAVSMDYFNDAVFLGNSRTETFVLYTGLSNATSYAFKGFSVSKVLEEPAVEINGQKLKILEALKHKEFSKVYMMFGFNETGWVYPDLFIEKYEKIIDGVRESNPNATIYVQSIIPVSQKASENNGDENNQRIDEYNGLIKEMVKRKDVHYLNVAESVVDETGVLPEEAAFDGVHLKKEWAEKWLDYLKTHTVKD